MKGRPKKPDSVKKLQGTFQKCREAHEVKFEIAKIPLEFGKDWESIKDLTFNQLRDIGIVANVDMGLIEGYAKALERYFQADVQLRATSMVTEEGKISPWYDIAERSLKQATQIGQLFGITPSARARIPQQQQPASKLEILKKKIS